MRAIPLSQGLETLVDDADYPFISQYRWYAKRYGSAKIYAVRKTSRKEHPEHKQCMRSLHRELMRLQLWEGLVDHINGNTLDNRRENLRLASISENNQNARKRKDNTSGYKGVTLYRSGRWHAQIWYCGRNTSLGTYDDKEEAARAYDKAAKELFGKFAYLNFN